MMAIKKIKVILKDKTPIIGSYTGETVDNIHLIQDGFTFETQIPKNTIKSREFVYPYTPPTELEMLKYQEEKLIKSLIENRKKQMSLTNC